MNGRPTLTVGSLFAGIGGFDLGLERAGMRSVWQCEIDPYAQRVLAKHWPSVLRVPDIRDVRSGTVPYVDVICGGFPCQDVSDAGPRTGIDGARSGLWSEYARVVGELRPRYVIVENVAALLARGLGRVLGDLAALGYDAEWDCLPASAFGAPHQRDRLWLVAYPEEQRRGQGRAWGPSASGQGQREPERALQVVADTAGEGLEGRTESHASRGPRPELAGRDPQRGWTWPDEPDLPRVADGVPDWVERMRATGNALVPQIAEWIGRRLIEWELANTADRP